jgi:hypothetical protein
MATHSCALPGCHDAPTGPFAHTFEGSEIPEGGRCQWCKSTVDLMDGDGDVAACRGCAEIFGKIIRDPESVDQGRAAEQLADRHVEVVNLVRLINGVRIWRWTDTWPGVELRTA